MISEHYREQNRLLHEQEPRYGSKGGMKHHVQVRNLIELYRAKSVVDYGCGKGSLRRMLGKIVQNYDPATFPELPDAADLVVCTDVLEHIEPEYLDDVLAHIAALTNKAAFLVVACRKAAQSLPDGRNTHLIVQPATWWAEQIEKHLRIVSKQVPYPQEVHYVCERR